MSAGETRAEAPLWRNVGFQLLWLGSAFTFLGFEISYLVYPLIILAGTGSPGSASLFAGVQIAAALVFGLPAGGLADRFDRRALLLTAEALRAVATASVVFALVEGVLTMPHILVAAAVIGASQPLGGSARMLMVRALVPPSQLTAAVTQEEVRGNGALLLGAPIAGVLYALGRAVPLVVTALCYLASFLCALAVRPPAAEPGPPEDGKRPRALSGLSIIWQAPTLRGVVLFTTAVAVIAEPLLLVTVVQLQQRGTPSAVIGLVSAAIAVGGLAGAPLVRPLHRLPPGVLMIGAAVVNAGLIAMMAVPLGPWWLASILFLLTLWAPATRVLVDILVLRQVPDNQRGRAFAASMTLHELGSALGMVCAGQLLEHFSAGVTVLVLAGAMLAVVFAGLANRGLRHARWPEDLSSNTSAEPAPAGPQ